MLYVKRLAKGASSGELEALKEKEILRTYGVYSLSSGPLHWLYILLSNFFI